MTSLSVLGRPVVTGVAVTAGDAARFAAKVRREDGCWRWTAFTDPKGYGSFRWTHGGYRNMQRAHRVAYMWLVGPIPDGHHLDHRCDNTWCVNPDHLAPALHEDNMARRVGKPVKTGAGRLPHRSGWKPTGRPPGRPRTPVEQRFWPKVDKESSPSGCWLWTGAVVDTGYGRFYRDRRPEQAHRVAWELTNGPISEGLVLDHICRNRRCVKPDPDHLQPTTHRLNILAGTGFSARNASVTHCPQGHPYDEENTYLHPVRKQRNCKTCRRERMRHAGAAKRAARGRPGVLERADAAAREVDRQVELAGRPFGAIGPAARALGISQRDLNLLLGILHLPADLKAEADLDKRGLLPVLGRIGREHVGDHDTMRQLWGQVRDLTASEAAAALKAARPSSFPRICWAPATDPAATGALASPTTARSRGAVATDGAGSETAHDLLTELRRSRDKGTQQTTTTTRSTARESTA